MPAPRACPEPLASPHWHRTGPLASGSYEPPPRSFCCSEPLDLTQEKGTSHEHIRSDRTGDPEL